MFRQTEPTIRTQLRPFTQKVDTVVGDLRRAAKPLRDSSNQLSGAVTELNQVLNALAYNPSGSQESYLFYLSWLNHNTNGTFLTQDGLGPIRRGLLTYTCFASQLADALVLTRPQVNTARDLTRLPTTDEICPSPFKSKGKGSASEGGGDGAGTTTTDETTTDETTSSTTTDGSTSTTTTGSGDASTPEPGSATDQATTESSP
jgi:hypothetical protein